MQCKNKYRFIDQVILAEDNEIRDKLAEHDLHVQTIAEVAPIEVSYFNIMDLLSFYFSLEFKML